MTVEELVDRLTNGVKDGEWLPGDDVVISSHGQTSVPTTHVGQLVISNLLANAKPKRVVAIR